MEDKNRLGLIIVLVLFVAIFFIGRCSKECPTRITPIEVTTPEVKGDFKTPGILVPIDSHKLTEIIFKDSLIYVPTVNKDLMDKYLQTLEENDQLKSMQQYAEAIKINEYNTPFEDENIKLNIYSKTEGKLLEIEPDYIIKSKTITVPVEVPKPKEKVFTMNIGAYTTYSIELKTFDPGVKAEFVNKKGHTLSAGYSLDKNIMVGYTIPLFSIKK